MPIGGVETCLDMSGELLGDPLVQCQQDGIEE